MIFNGEPITIRDALAADREAVNSIHRAEYPSDSCCYANNIGLPGTVNLVAVKGGEVAGFISVLINQPNLQGRYLWERMRPYIGFLIVSERNRRAGIGTGLVAQASRRAFGATGAGWIYLECRNENEKAQKLYEKMGFEHLSAERVEKEFGRPPASTSRVYRLRNVQGLER